jgi:hypothetical protein
MGGRAVLGFYPKGLEGSAQSFQPWETSTRGDAPCKL